MNVKFTPFIMLDGHANEAIRFYEQALGAQVVFKQTFGEIPEDGNPSPIAEEWKPRIAHSVLVVGSSELFVGDTEPNQQLERGDQVNICVTVKEVPEAERIYDSLRSEGKVLMPLQPVYFSPAFGMVTDRFGVTFQIFTETI
ncbi:VOC family protein [Cohnella thailandensis]|uniref:VOC family protein n=1 Tax=Cohnella thailandensis TaxID=557557 RepID=A0A841SWL7_9BACL|nr:VOC family protein [Cohnella thailandensis]MBB6634568.1 VOC family protein [Cohnella thailandensis]MBP1972877.1 PhnB protein [Cohnella thailandensis]